MFPKDDIRVALAMFLTALITSLSFISIINPNALPVLQNITQLASLALSFYFMKTK